MPPLVSLLRQRDYEPKAVQAAVVELLQPLGGMAAFVKPGDRVVLKPNLVTARPPEDAVTTHPAVVEAVAKLALDCGGKVTLGDSPGIQSVARVADKAGLGEVCRRLNIPLVEFSSAEQHDEKRTFRRLELARELLEADLVINLPKLKTHGQMLMTMAVKNLFGAVVGARKLQWHYRAGVDKLAFAGMLYEICRAVAPRLHIVDAILLDVLGIPREQLLTLQAAACRGNTAWRETQTAGPAPAELRPAKWDLPRTGSLFMLDFGALKSDNPFNRWLRKQMSAYPQPREGACVNCGVCVNVCPAKALAPDPEAGRPRLEATKCIRCYCCHELCPHQAMDLKRGWLGRTVGRLLSSREP